MDTRKEKRIYDELGNIPGLFYLKKKEKRKKRREKVNRSVRIPSTNLFPQITAQGVSELPGPVGVASGASRSSNS